VLSGGIFQACAFSLSAISPRKGAPAAAPRNDLGAGASGLSDDCNTSEAPPHTAEIRRGGPTETCSTRDDLSPGRCLIPQPQRIPDPDQDVGQRRVLQDVARRAVADAVPSLTVSRSPLAVSMMTNAVGNSRRISRSACGPLIPSMVTSSSRRSSGWSVQHHSGASASRPEL
jgi:hypothetical protein